jgi:hypothetical protein
MTTAGQVGLSPAKNVYVRCLRTSTLAEGASASRVDAHCLLERFRGRRLKDGQTRIRITDERVRAKIGKWPRG